MRITRDILLKRLFDRHYGGRIIRNDLRGELVEEIIAAVLEPDWELCADDWSAFDLKHCSLGYRMQVKQSSAEQTWIAGTSGRSSPRFSIAEKTGRFEGLNWIAERVRNADVFVFAWHPVTGALCDHACAEQWMFYVVNDKSLPQQQSIGLTQLQKLADGVAISELKSIVSGICENLAA